MSVSVARFRQDFPDFKETSDELVRKKLAAASLRIASRIWGTLTDQGIMYLAAHLLSISPEGEQSRLKAKNRMTTYGSEWKRMKREVTFGVGRVS